VPSLSTVKIGFYPAFVIVVGTHQLLFMFLYRMWQFGILAATMIGAGIVIALYLPAVFSLAGWLTALFLLVFAVVGRSVALRENRASA